MKAIMNRFILYFRCPRELNRSQKAAWVIETQWSEELVRWTLHIQERGGLTSHLSYLFIIQMPVFPRPLRRIQQIEQQRSDHRVPGIRRRRKRLTARQAGLFGNRALLDLVRLADLKQQLATGL